MIEVILYRSGAAESRDERDPGNHDDRCGRKSTTAIIKRLRGMPEVHSLHTTNGTWDLVGELRACSLQHFDRVLREVRQIDGILNSETGILLSSV